MKFKESLVSIKHDFRKSKIEARGGQCLDKNCVLYFDRPVEGILDLHITEGFTRQVLREAHARLLEIVASDISIQQITIISPVVAQHQRLMERMGFEVDDSLTEEIKKEIQSEFPKNMQGKPFIQMQISREKFLGINPDIISDN